MRLLRHRQQRRACCRAVPPRQPKQLSCSLPPPQDAAKFKLSRRAVLVADGVLPPTPPRAAREPRGGGAPNDEPMPTVGQVYRGARIKQVRGRRGRGRAMGTSTAVGLPTRSPLRAKDFFAPLGNVARREGLVSCCPLSFSSLLSPPQSPASRQVQPFGAFVEVAPRREGLLRVGDWALAYTTSLEAEAKEGDLIDVVVTDVSADGKFKLSRKALLVSAP